MRYIPRQRSFVGGMEVRGVVTDVEVLLDALQMQAGEAPAETKRERYRQHINVLRVRARV